MELDKDILRDYTDACELIKETEEDIHRLYKKKSGASVTSPREKRQGKTLFTIPNRGSVWYKVNYTEISLQNLL